jgi:hypothetical protein
MPIAAAFVAESGVGRVHNPHKGDENATKPNVRKGDDNSEMT